MAERVALNFLQQLSGIATLTQRFCQAVEVPRGHSRHEKNDPRAGGRFKNGPSPLAEERITGARSLMGFSSKTII